MRFLPLCREDDPLLTIVRQRYGAHPVAMPRGGIALVDVLVVDDGFAQRWGPLGKLVTGQPPLEEALGPSPPQLVADLSGARSGGVDARVGLAILGALLNALGIPAPGISTRLGRSRQLSFKFSRVTQRGYSAAAIGEALHRRRLRRTNSATALLAERGTMLIINSVLESPEFAVCAERHAGIRAGIDIPAIKKILADAGGDVTAQRSAKNEVTFQASVPVVFGVTCLRLDTAAHGGFTSLQLGPAEVVIRSLTARRPVLYASEPDGLDLVALTGRTTGETVRRMGFVEAVGIPGGPMIVNASPAALGPPGSLLVPDNYEAPVAS